MGGECALISAVRAGDTDLVRILLHEDSDPDYLNAAFGLAVRMHAGHIAQLLLQYGAESGQSRAEDLIPLREGADSGSPALFEVLLNHKIRGRYPKSELLEALDIARRWHERGVEAELRRRTGSRDAVVRTQVQDDEYYSVDECTLGGMTVRDGHGAILTYAEELLGVQTSFEELMDRALARADQNHPTWGGVTLLLGGRRDQANWTAVAALRTSSDPSRRLFCAEVLRLTHLFDDSDEDAFAGPALDMFTEWSAEETDLDVLTEVLVALGEHIDPRAEAALLPHAGHPDTRVRRAVAHGFSEWSSPPAFSGDARAVLLLLMTDPDAVVRKAACRVVADGRDRDPLLADAMAAAVLDDADRLVRLAAVSGLALHDDERCVEAARLLGPPERGSQEEERYFDEVWRYAWRRDHP